MKTVLIDLFSFSLGSGRFLSLIQERVNPAGRLAPLVLGVVFALAFCPVSAAFFFGSLIPLAVKHSSPVALPLLFGAGTALPVLLFAALLAFGAQSLATTHARLAAIEPWVRRGTGLVFILAGIYLSLRYVWSLPG